MTALRPPLGLRWQHELPDGPIVLGPPRIVDDLVVARHGPTVVGLDLADGAARFSVHLGDDRYDSALLEWTTDRSGIPFVVTDRTLNDRSEVVAFDLAGKPLWDAPVPGVVGQLVPAEDAVFVLARESKGPTIQRAGPTGLEQVGGVPAGTIALRYVDGRFYAGVRGDAGGPGGVFCASPGDTFEKLSDLAAAQLFATSRALAVEKRDQLDLLAPSGAPLWRMSLESPIFDLEGDSVATVSRPPEGDRVELRERDTGAVRWIGPPAESRIRNVVQVDRLVLVAHWRGLLVLDRGTGQQLQQLESPARRFGPFDRDGVRGGLLVSAVRSIVMLHRSAVER